MSMVRNIHKKLQTHILKSLKKREKDIVFSVAIILVSVLSFFGGMAYEEQDTAGVMVIEKPVVQTVQGVEQGKVAGAENSKSQISNPNMETQSGNTQDCLFVGSKNSDKYHSPSCSYAKRIKPENTVCFHSKEEAEKAGYVEGCIK